MELTSRQREIFNFIRTFIKERGYPPSVREIGEKFNIYPRAVFDHLKALERKGLSTKGRYDKIPSFLARRVKNGTLTKESGDDRKFYWAEPESMR